MGFLVILGVCALVFFLSPLVLRANAAFVFLALCGGELLSAIAGPDVTDITKSIFTSASLPISTIVNTTLIMLPPLFTLILLRHSVGKSKLFMNVLPGICAAVLGALLVAETFALNIQSKFLSLDFYKTLQDYKTISLVIGMASTLLVIYFDRPKHGHDKRKHKR